MPKISKSILMLPLALLTILAFVLNPAPPPAEAQWPPFDFSLTPSYENGRITYKIQFFSFMEHGDITDLTINIPLPEGTRYLEGSAQSTTAVSFDGKEVKFFTSLLEEEFIGTASFIVEVIDPKQTVVTTQAWLAWKGKLAGDFLAEAVSIDITRPTLKWDQPPVKRLLLEASATATNDLITYFIYPTNLGGRMWDVTIKFPIPEGTTFLSAEAQPPFVASFDGQEATFAVSELEEQVKVAPLQVKVSTKSVTTPVVVTHAWASWKNEGRTVGRIIPLQEDARTGDIVVRPHATEWVVADLLNDVPLNDYDVTSVTLQEEGDGFKVTFYTSGDIGPIGKPIHFLFYLNTECVYSLEYQIHYNHANGRALIQAFNPDTSTFNPGPPVEAQHPGPRMITLHIPYEFLKDSPSGGKDFCGVGRVLNVTTQFNMPVMEVERAPNRDDARLILHYVATNTSSLNTVNVSDATLDLPQWPSTPTPPAEEEASATEDSDWLAASVPNVSYESNDALSRAALASQEFTETQPGSLVGLPSTPSNLTPLVATSSLADLKGKLVVPIDNSQGAYNLHIFSMPDGREIIKIPNSSQPHFRFDGQRLLLNWVGGGIGNIYEHNLADGTEIRVTDAPANEYPNYDLWGNRVAYGNSELTLGKAERLLNKNFHRMFTTDFINVNIVLPPPDPPLDIDIDVPIKVPIEIHPHRPFMFVQCSLLSPLQEPEERCQDVAGRGMLIPAGHMGEIQGKHPVWTANDRIVFSGCDTWAGARLCGIYSVPAASTRGFSDGFIPIQLTQESSDLPSDTKGNLIAFTSRRDGNWEAYIMNLDGSEVKNLSHNPSSNDGLPTISPDRNWVAFVSDRTGRWAIWVAPIAGGEATKLFDLPANVPWAEGNRAWINERISWGGTATDHPTIWQPAPTPNYHELYAATPIPGPTPTGTPTPTAMPK